MNLSEIKAGMRVKYIPEHACGNPWHPDCEVGTVSSVTEHNAFVRFDQEVHRLGWAGATSKLCSPDHLRLNQED